MGPQGEKGKKGGGGEKGDIGPQVSGADISCVINQIRLFFVICSLVLS